MIRVVRDTDGARVLYITFGRSYVELVYDVDGDIILTLKRSGHRARSWMLWS